MTAKQLTKLNNIYKYISQLDLPPKLYNKMKLWVATILEKKKFWVDKELIDLVMQEAYAHDEDNAYNLLFNVLDYAIEKGYYSPQYFNWNVELKEKL